MKYCKDCSKYKPLKEWGINSSKKDGLANYCLICFNKRRLKSYIKHISYYRDYYDRYWKNKGKKVYGRKYKSKYSKYER